jgi:cytochrome c oxidase cbb3-type subunit III
MRTFITTSLCTALLLTVACERERRDYRTPSSAASPSTTPAPQSPLEPGNPDPNRVTAMEQPASESGKQPYESNAYAVSEGKRLYAAYNCVGCHANGGGGMGPPLMDANWIYGGTPQNIHDTIVEGRPNGMPSFRGKVPDFQVWEIVAYVRSMSGQLPKDIAPGRSDHMSVKKPEQSTPGEHQHER